MPISRIFPITRRRLFKSPAAQISTEPDTVIDPPVISQVSVDDGKSMKRKRPHSDIMTDLPDSISEEKASTCEWK